MAAVAEARAARPGRGRRARAPGRDGRRRCRSVAYRAGSDAAARGDWEEGASLLERSVEIDPWHPAGPKSLAVAAERAGRDDLAREAAESAVEPGHNPGDAPSWVNLAILCEEEGDATAGRATERAVAMAGFFEAELLNAAISYEALGMADEADEAYRRSLLSQRLTAFALDWPRDVPIGDATLEDDFGALLEFNRLLALVGDGRADRRAPRSPIRRRGPSPMACATSGWRRRLGWSVRSTRRPEQRRDLGRGDRPPRTTGGCRSTTSSQLQRSFAAHRSRSAMRRISMRSQTYDIATFRTYPADGFVSAAQRLGTSPPYPWILQRTLP